MLSFPTMRISIDTLFVFVSFISTGLTCEIVNETRAKQRQQQVDRIESDN
jgi:hypothetical protein